MLIPAKEPLFTVPYKALYGKDKLYKLVKDKQDIMRMQSIRILPQGEFFDAGDTGNNLSAQHSLQQNNSLLLFSSDQIKTGDKIIITHLPNALNGLKVEEQQ